MRCLHQYIERSSNAIKTEHFFGDGPVRVLYSTVREHAPSLFNLLTQRRASAVLAYLMYDLPLSSLKKTGLHNIDLAECVDPHELGTLRKLFQRKIRYWECRPLEGSEDSVVSPADSKVLLGSFREQSHLYVKEKFFSLSELLSTQKRKWIDSFTDGDFAIFRLTPEKYHFNHTPVAGRVLDFYRISGQCHSCNPFALVVMASPYSKNERVITVIDTDVPHGTGVGLVAMVEVVALMIGDIVQCYSEDRYESPRQIEQGMFLKKGCPKSLYRPGSSTDILLFQQDRVVFCQDLIENLRRYGVQTRFSRGLDSPCLVETEVRVRSEIGRALPSDTGAKRGGQCDE